MRRMRRDILRCSWRVFKQCCWDRSVYPQERAILYILRRRHLSVCKVGAHSLWAAHAVQLRRAWLQGSRLAVQRQRRKRSASAAGLTSDRNVHVKRHQSIQDIQQSVPQPRAAVAPAKASSASTLHQVAWGQAGISAETNRACLCHTGHI